ncbi:MAG: LCP family protein [Chloroflexota bacterium]
MDDANHHNMPDLPDNDAGYPSDDDLDQPEHRPGVSHAEFTQIASNQRPPRKYAIPDADPLDLTVGSLPTRYEPPIVSASIARANVPISPSRAIPVPQSPIRPPTPTYFPPPPPPRRTGILARPIWLLMGAVMVLASCIAAFGGGTLIVLHFGGGGSSTSTPTQANVADVASTSAPTPTVGLAIQPWDGTHRLTILLMGIDKRPNEKGTAFRTDSMMIVSLDPATKTVGILSVPRDLFVDIPTDTVVRNSYGLQRVNAAYVIGELARPGYGPQLAMQTVQYNLGIRINNYVVYEFGTVINGIDTVGGIDINVPYAIYDPSYPDMYYGYDPLRIPAGPVHMDGALALKYARTRHQTSDFDRAKRQQQVLLAVRDKVLNANMVGDLVKQAPDIWSKLSTTTHSDLTFDQLVRLALYFKDIPQANVHQGVIDTNYVTGQNYQGAAILVPERSKIGPLLQQVFGNNYNS